MRALIQKSWGSKGFMVILVIHTIAAMSLMQMVITQKKLAMKIIIFMFA